MGPHLRLPRALSGDERRHPGPGVPGRHRRPRRLGHTDPERVRGDRRLRAAGGQPHGHEHRQADRAGAARPAHAPGQPGDRRHRGLGVHAPGHGEREGRGDRPLRAQRERGRRGPPRQLRGGPHRRRPADLVDPPRRRRAAGHAAAAHRAPGEPRLGPLGAVQRRDHLVAPALRHPRPGPGRRAARPAGVPRHRPPRRPGDLRPGDRHAHRDRRAVRVRGPHPRPRRAAAHPGVHRGAAGHPGPADRGPRRAAGHHPLAAHRRPARRRTAAARRGVTAHRRAAAHHHARPERAVPRGRSGGGGPLPARADGACSAATGTRRST